MFKSFKILITALVFSFIILSLPIAFARGGGGGSGGGGGGGSHGGGSHSSSPSYHHGTCISSTAIQTEQECLDKKSLTNYLIIGFLIYIFVLFPWFNKIFVYLKKKEKLKTQDSVLAKKVEEVFYAFQKAWSEFDAVTLEKITSPRFYQQLVLELGVLKNEHRENRMTNVNLILGYVDSSLYSKVGISTFKAEVQGQANDVLYDTDLKDELYNDDSSFTEYWTFIWDGIDWKLDTIEQATEDVDAIDESVKSFATKNNFFYNPDFGWLMIPNKGNLFSDASFETSDVNNHVIGVYKNKIVEFYSIIFKQGGAEYFIGQAILPKSYNRIVIERKNKFSFFERGKSGLRKIELESIAFNDEFNVFSDNADTMTTFELLHPAFMEYIMKLPYKVSIEVVGNTLYFYTQSKEIDYDKLLEILSRAFDEIKE